MPCSEGAIDVSPQTRAAGEGFRTGFQSFGGLSSVQIARSVRVAGPRILRFQRSVKRTCAHIAIKADQHAGLRVFGNADVNWQAPLTVVRGHFANWSAADST